MNRPVKTYAGGKPHYVIEMNANELADELESWKATEELSKVMQQAATMLRQLQAENDALKSRELTDFEIKGVLGLDECWVGEDCSIPDMIAFAKAILRKAQEK